MKTNSKWITVVAILTLGTTLAVAAPNDGNGGGHYGRGRHELGAKFAEKLNLTDAQKQQIADLRKSSRQENAAFFQTAKQTRQEFHAAKKAGDTAKLEALKPTLESQRAQMKQIRTAEEQKIATTVFTPAQQSQWQQMKAQREAKREQWKQNHTQQ